jgi:hypothetical protein
MKYLLFSLFLISLSIQQSAFSQTEINLIIQTHNDKRKTAVPNGINWNTMVWDTNLGTSGKINIKISTKLSKWLPCYWT